MFALVVAASLAAATPRPLPSADSGVYVPNLSKMDGLLGFMQRAGTRSSLMRPSTWFSEFHPLLYVDFTRPESLSAAGISRSGSATVTYRKDGRMTCVELSDPRVYEERIRPRISAFGTLWEGKLSGVPVVAAKAANGRFMAGHARKGNLSCAVVGPADATALLQSAVAAVGRPTLEGGWSHVRETPGAAVLVLSDTVAGLSGKGDVLTVRGRTTQLATPELQQNGSSPYATMQETGVALVRSQVKKNQVPLAVRSLTGALLDLCEKCSREKLRAIEAAIAKELTGHVALNVHDTKVKGRLKTASARYFAAKHVWLAELRDPAGARPALEAVSSLEGAREIEGGYAIPVEGGEVRVGVHGNHLFLANDPEALAATLKAIPAKPSKLAHGVEFSLDPAKTARALGQISVFDIMGSRELAGLFAVSTEVGPLLTLTRSVEGWADSAGKRAHDFGLTWTLKPAAPPPK